MGAHSATAMEPTNEHVTQAIHLFEYLRQVEQLKSPPIRTTESYEDVRWLGDVPEHPAIRTALSTTLDGPVDPSPILAVDRVPVSSPPAVPDDIADCAVGDVDDPDSPPTLKPTAGRSEEAEIAADTGSWGPGDPPGRHGVSDPVATAAERRRLEEAFDAWMTTWTAWAEQERVDRTARRLYEKLFTSRELLHAQAEEFELRLGVGLLSWRPTDHPGVQRHLFTVPAEYRFNDSSGRIEVHLRPDLEMLTVELDMLDPHCISDPRHVAELKDAARDYASHPLDREAIGELTRRMVNTLDARGSYEDAVTRPRIGDAAAATFAPALILRKRSQRGIIEIFETIIEQLRTASEVPAGLMPLVDADFVPPAAPDPSPGGIVTVDDDPYLPLPVNEQQLQIIRSVDRQSQTVVQGPPGTGKTHTAAALISHLLAQGKRVLVTAHTDRALKEVRGKLPDEIRPLSVAVVGASHDDMSDLKLAVDTIAKRSGEHDTARSAARLDTAMERVDRLSRERAEIYRRLRESREEETTPVTHGRYAGTLATIAKDHGADAAEHGWLAKLCRLPETSAPPISDEDAMHLLGLLRDTQLRTDEPAAALPLPELDTLTTPEDFARQCLQEHRASADVDAREQAVQDNPASPAIMAMPVNDRHALQRTFRSIADEAAELERRDETWMNDALGDIRAGKAYPWRSRAEQVDGWIGQAEPLVRALTPFQVTLGDGDRGALESMAGSLLELLENGQIKTLPDGRPKISMFTPKVVKQSAPLFDLVRVNAKPPTSREQMQAVVEFIQAERVLDALDRAWPLGLDIPQEDTLRERLDWHITEVQLLHRVLALGDRLTQEDTALHEAGIPRPDWTSLATIRSYAAVVDAADAQDTLAAARSPLNDLRTLIELGTEWHRTETGEALRSAVDGRDPDAYSAAQARVAQLWQVRKLVSQRETLSGELRAAAPELIAELLASPQRPEWGERMAGLARAWAWAATDTWLRGRDTTDANALQARTRAIDDEIRQEVEVIASTRAWDHALDPERMTGTAKADLMLYAQSVRHLGKGTGKYAVRQRAEIKKIMSRCRPSVPVWIMPIYRIAEQLRVTENMFDVVIVDEASQAGTEAAFLQYLAPKVVVIGDDRQVSPGGVGVDQQQLRDLADQYLGDDRYKSAWQNPKRSLFDDANMRYGHRITLIEHRRCVPEIIGFSNRIAYEPEGVRLIPVRQPGANRLTPIRAVHVTDGYVQGRTNKVNRPEVDAIADQIEKCLVDPQYDGLTFGVISLLGSAQARAIEAELLHRVDPEEWAARDLRCGDSAAFQGSERDVMFLSMVAAPEEGRRMMPLTRLEYIQRFNVAASRAKDQMWVFHSMARGDLTNPEDMRFQLLDYCYGVIGRSGLEHEGALTTTVPEDTRTAPFDSLFEQRVCNRILGHGYAVIPQFEALGYRIDLVVVCAAGRLAVECDGDHWHGPEQFAHDLGRQRELERCGWRFFRVRESLFTTDPSAALADLWPLLDELSVMPAPEHREAIQATPTPVGSAGSVDSSGSVGAATDDPAPDRDAESLQVIHPSPTVPTQPHTTLAENVLLLKDAVPVAPAPAVRRAPVQHEPSATVLPENASHLARYVAFDGETAPVDGGTMDELVDGLVSIVEVEGPIVGERLRQVYVKASGRQRAGKALAKQLNRAISRAVRSGDLVGEDPLNDVGFGRRTFTVLGQPTDTVRELGPRTLAQVPARELALLLRQSARDSDDLSQDGIYRHALALLGRHSLTHTSRAELDRAWSLVRE